MAEQRPSFGKVVLYIVLGVIAVVVGIQLIWGLLPWLLVLAGVIAVGYVAFKAGQASVGGSSRRRQIPR